MVANRVVVSTLAVSVAVACAQAEDAPSAPANADTGGQSSYEQGGGAGKLPTAGSSAVAQGGVVGAAGFSSSGGKAGASSGGAFAAGTGSGGRTSGGSAGTSTGGVTGSAGRGGSSGAGTSAGGTTSTGLSCNAEAVAGAGGADPGAPGAGTGGAQATGAAFFDDFESGVSEWATTRGTWALVDDGSKAYDQSLQENKLQLAVANGVCLADQVIDAKVEIVAFKGQSNSYVAALFGRVLGPSTHYLLALGSDGKLALRKRVNSTSTGATAIGTAAALSITVGSWYDVHFEIIGTTLKGCVGAVCVTGTDSSIASGSVGLGTVNTAARFDDVKVTAP